MRIMIKEREIDLAPEHVSNLFLTFDLWRGRRFSYRPEGGNGFKYISLNELISAIKNAPITSQQDIDEIIAFREQFNILKDRGYTEVDSKISHEKFFTQIITKIKHLFAKIIRNKLLDDLDLAIFKAVRASEEFNNSLLEGPENFNESEETESPPLEPFDFKHLPKDIQVEILRKSDFKSLLAFHLTNEESKVLVETFLPKELKKSST